MGYMSVTGVGCVHKDILFWLASQREGRRPWVILNARARRGFDTWNRSP